MYDLIKLDESSNNESSPSLFKKGDIVREIYPNNAFIFSLAMAKVGSNVLGQTF